MKKRMIFPLMLLCAPAVLQAMEVAMQSDFWQLNPESLSSMEERFVSASLGATPYHPEPRDAAGELALQRRANQMNVVKTTRQRMQGLYGDALVLIANGRAQSVASQLAKLQATLTDADLQENYGIKLHLGDGSVPALMKAFEAVQKELANRATADKAGQARVVALKGALASRSTIAAHEQLRALQSEREQAEDALQKLAAQKRPGTIDGGIKYDLDTAQLAHTAHEKRKAAVNVVVERAARQISNAEKAAAKHAVSPDHLKGRVNVPRTAIKSHESVAEPRTMPQAELASLQAKEEYNRDGRKFLGTIEAGLKKAIVDGAEDAIRGLKTEITSLEERKSSAEKAESAALAAATDLTKKNGVNKAAERATSHRKTAELLAAAIQEKQQLIKKIEGFKAATASTGWFVGWF